MKVVFKAPERFDADGVAANRKIIERLAQSDDDVIVDMSQVELIDGSGFGAIAHLHKRLARQKHSVSVVNVGGQPRDLMAKTGMLDVLTAHVSIDKSMKVVVAAKPDRLEETDIASDRKSAA